MSPAWIRPRTVDVSTRNPRGRSYQVLYRLGGRESSIQSAGTFKAERDAKLRRDLVAGWLARGLDPKIELAKLKTGASGPDFAVAAAALIRARVDVDATTKAGYEVKARRIARDLGAKPLHALTVADGQQLVARLSETMRPSSVKGYIGFARMVVDHAGVEPNVLRDRRVKLPKQVATEASPPSAVEVVTILERVGRRYREPLVVLEQTAMRVGEVVSLRLGDVDFAGNRFRLDRTRTKSSRPRWVQVPDWLMRHLEDRFPVDDRVPGRHVFEGVTEHTLKQAMARACRAAGIPLYSPHDLRHRRASLWHHQGVPTRELQERGGWSRASIPLDIYAHVMPGDEVPEETLKGVLVRSPW